MSISTLLPPARDPLCALKRETHPACRLEPIYKEYNGKPYCVLHYPATDKIEDFKLALKYKLDTEDFTFQGVWFPGPADFLGFTFSTNADFSDAQFSECANFFDAQFSAAANFSDAKFSAAANFSNAKFSGDASFSDAQFSGDAAFSSAQFSADVYFFDAQFSAAARFRGAHFSKYVGFKAAQFSADADFYGAQFSARAYFDSAVFNAPVNFKRAKFIKADNSRGQSADSDGATGTSAPVLEEAETSRVDFAGAHFKDSVTFEENTFAEDTFITFAAATFEKPERAVFHTVRLRPHWFINIDTRKFTFIDVDWGELHQRDAIHKEIAALERSERGELSRLLYVTYQQLAVNAEENNRYETAADFRYMAMDVKRLQRGRKLDPLRLSWWYWLLSGYGERITRAFAALVVIWALFAVVYWSGDATWWQPKQPGKGAAESVEAGKPSPGGVEATQASARAQLSLPEALVYSAGVLTLQKPEPSPANKRAKAAVLFQTILGPLQAALLALAIRRKFMR